MKTRKLRLTLATMAVLSASHVHLHAASSDTQDLNFTINEVIEFDALEGALGLTISSFDSSGNGSFNQTGHYRLFCNANSARKVTVALDSAMPSNTSLDVAMVPPPGAAQVGPAFGVGTTATDIITGINKVNVVSSDINYTFRASVLAATGNFTRTVTFSVVP
jgi:hypothetical protein